MDPKILPASHPLPFDRGKVLKRMNENPYEILGVTTDAPPSEIRRACEAIVATFRKDEIAVYTLIESEAERTEFLRQVEEAHNLLTDYQRRTAWDEEHDVAERWEDQTLPPENNPLPSLPEEGQQVLDPEDETGEMPAQITDKLVIDRYDGSGLQRVRVARSLSRAEVANTLRLSVTQVRAIEEMNAGRLPALVYVKGFVRNYARFLRLDVDRVVREYIEAFEHG